MLRQLRHALPEAEHQGDRRQTFRPPPLGQRVQERVGRRVVGLTGRPERAGCSGEEDELGRREVPSELVQVDRPVDLGGQHPGEPVAVERGQDAVIER
ncbi:MAG TPA: hypothetical protein VM712_01045, partial [Gaiellales bacterium]|nr:hypothetical protein [Gaiellales bacterium]